MHVHAGCSRGYSFDDRFTEVLDCLTTCPCLSFPEARDEVGGFGGGPVEAEHPLGGGARGRAGAAPEKRELRRGSRGGRSTGRTASGRRPRPAGTGRNGPVAAGRGRPCVRCVARTIAGYRARPPAPDDPRTGHPVRSRRRRRAPGPAGVRPGPGRPRRAQGAWPIDDGRRPRHVMRRRFPTRQAWGTSPGRARVDADRARRPPVPKPRPVPAARRGPRRRCADSTFRAGHGMGRGLPHARVRTECGRLSLATATTDATGTPPGHGPDPRASRLTASGSVTAWAGSSNGRDTRLSADSCFRAGLITVKGPHPSHVGNLTRHIARARRLSLATPPPAPPASRSGPAALVVTRVSGPRKGAGPSRGRS
ncbi:hypothetical protein HNR57_003450 [Streptomyces paradoxus]|uniref:Uncharacterized protein n=1 Tax=Streptomyces paradoxus TaxID=66375 RepID=A0A7W9TBD3_9ACTN|nr:hypothetical protein [Streptomyces paradoxus]